MSFETTRLVICPLVPEHAPAVLVYYERNREHLAPWEPARPPDFYALAYHQRAIADTMIDVRDGRAAPFVAFMREDRERIVASINIFNIVRGALWGAILGYGVDAEVQGQGVGTEAVGAVVDYAFTKLRLHRVTASYNPMNERSGRLLRRLGFQFEGYARDFLFINGKWCDSILTAKLNPDPDFMPDSR
jgi:ribosomal-protein-alanine N-acetyltransferase